MTKFLAVLGSPRTHDSASNAIAQSYLEAYRAAHPYAEIDELDVWAETLPTFDGTKAAAKMSFMTGQAMEGGQQSAWDEVLKVVERFRSADAYLFAVPMWNHGLPYRVKQYVDIIMQPGLTFGLDPARGYFGLLGGKQATVIYTSGVNTPGGPPAFGVDYHSTYFDYVLDTMGLIDRQTIRFQPTLMTADPAAGLAAARAQAHQLGSAIPTDVL